MNRKFKEQNLKLKYFVTMFTFYLINKQCNHYSIIIVTSYFQGYENMYLLKMIKNIRNLNMPV